MLKVHTNGKSCNKCAQMVQGIPSFLSYPTLDDVRELIEPLEQVSCGGVLVKKAYFLLQSRCEVALPYPGCLSEACKHHVFTVNLS